MAPYIRPKWRGFTAPFDKLFYALYAIIFLCMHKGHSHL